MNVAYNMDCLEAMREMQDNAFDLAVVDPPYGDALTDADGGGTLYNRFGGRFDQYKDPAGVNRSGFHGKQKYHLGTDHLSSSCRKLHTGEADGRELVGEIRKKIITWDVAPGKEYFKELFRVSRNQIIWGGNYFDLPRTRCFLIWRKTNVPQDFTMAMAEYAWTSFNANAKVFNFSAVGIPGRFHPTQKPVELYAWLFDLYAKPGDKILDTHLGSGSSRIAAYDAGLDFVGYEIDETYFKLQEERFARHSMQQNLF